MQYNMCNYILQQKKKKWWCSFDFKIMLTRYFNLLKDYLKLLNRMKKVLNYD